MKKHFLYLFFIVGFATSSTLYTHEDRKLDELHELLVAAAKKEDKEAVFTALKDHLNACIDQQSTTKFPTVTKNAIEDFWQSMQYYNTIPYPCHPSDFTKATWVVYPKFIRAETLLHGQWQTLDQEFSSSEYKIGEIAHKAQKSLLKSVKKATSIPLLEEDYDENYYSYVGLRSLEEYFNTTQKFLMLNEEQLNTLQEVLKSLQEPISSCIGSAWRVVNVRAWSIFPRNGQYYHHDGWHTDGFPLSAWKLYIFPNPTDQEKGTIEFQIHGTTKCVETAKDKGSWFLFQNAKIKHRFTAPKLTRQDGKKPQDCFVIEVTIVPSLIQDPEPYCAGLNAQWPYYPWHDSRVNREIAQNVIYLNIGDAKKYPECDWLNLNTESENPFVLSPHCNFPVRSQSIALTYSSYCLDCFTIPTFLRILSETSRVLIPEGLFVLKIPSESAKSTKWSKDNLVEYLARFDLEITSFDREAIVAQISHIKGIILPDDDSTYCLALKRVRNS